jgi:hypothetical protein
LKKLALVLTVLLLLSLALPAILPVRAQTAPQVSVTSQYSLNRYGFATLSVIVSVKNNGTGAVQVPDVGIGLGNLTSHVVAASVSGGHQMSNSSGGTFMITGGESVASGNTTSFTLSALLNGVTSHMSNGSLQVMVLTSPAVNLKLASLTSDISLPTSTTFVSTPKGFGQSNAGSNLTYTRVQTNITSQAASTLNEVINEYSLQDFHPLVVYSASRVISVGPGGNPQVEDTISFKNLGTTAISTLYVSPLTSSGGGITVQPASQPPLLNPASITLSSDGIDLTNSAVGYPVQAGNNYTIVYQYPLAQQYYTVSGGSVSLKIPMAPPIEAFVKSYSIQLSLPAGVRVAQSQSSAMSLQNATPEQGGTFNSGYSLSIGWALDSAVPAVSVLFVALLIGLFISKTTVSEEEETEEESATERASAMIKAFEDKTSLINQLFAEIPNAEPNERDKAYFDELRGRLDTYRGKALQRLNEVKQKSTTQKFFDILNQLHTTEREVDRAAKDTLNLYEQFYTNRMRKEVFDRLLPSYRKRLEKSLDQLSERLHEAQREAKLL